MQARLRHFLFCGLCASAFAFAFSGCGVKLPPIAPVHVKEPIPPKLNCSPTEPDCDRTDPYYRPRKR